MVGRPTLGCGDWWMFVCKKTLSHDVIFLNFTIAIKFRDVQYHFNKFVLIEYKVIVNGVTFDLLLTHGCF